MASKTLLQAKQINHGQSEIWLEAEGNELTPHRTLATNEVANVVRRAAPEDVFKAFYAEYHIALGHIASLDVANLDDIAAELKLKAVA
jgi:hypothetical protein